MRSIVLILGVAFSSVLTGCGDGLPKPVPVSGKIMFKGNPVEAAQVTFHASTATSGRSAAGTTGKDGTFKLTTINTDDGAAPGEYIITVSKQEAKTGGSEPIDINKEGGPGAAYGAAMAAAGSGKMDSFMKDTLPAKYGKPGESGLTRTVVKGDENNFTIELK
jgi:hypothetical protein